MRHGPRRVTLLLTTPGWRGSGTSFVKIAQGLAEAGHAVQLVAGSEDVALRLAAAGLEAHLVPTGDTGRREVGAMRALFAGQRTEVVLADAPRDVRIARYASLGHRRAIVWRHNLHSRRLATDLLQRWLFGGVRCVVHQSAYSVRVLAEASPWLRRPGVVIPNGFALDELGPDAAAGAQFRARHGMDAAIPLVVTPTSDAVEKALPVAEDAVRRLAATRNITWAHNAAGARRRDGSLLTIPLGVLGHGDYLDALRAADVVLLPAAGELFGNATAEAMALGRPVVTVRGGAAPEVVGDAGLLVPPADAGAMAEAVALLLDEPARARQLGAAARARIGERFSLDAMWAGYDRLVRETA